MEKNPYFYTQMESSKEIEISQRKESAILKKVEPEPDFILKIKNPNEDELDLAFELKPELALHFEIIPENVQGNIVEKDPLNIKYIANPTKKIERYVLYRGFVDYRNGNYYWKLSQKKPRSLVVRIQSHPFLGAGEAASIFVIVARLIIARPYYLLYIAIRFLLGKKKKKGV
jgi:hypothetical protein